MTNQQLHYNCPAREWIEALPLGNGRIGAMVYGSVPQEIYALNEDTLWSGSPTDHNDKNVWPFFEKARELALQKQYREAQQLIEQHLCGEYNEAYMPLGRLLIQQENNDGEIQEYQRMLDLSTAVHTVSYLQNGCRFVRESFLSAPRQALYVRYTSTGEKDLSVKIHLDSQLRYTSTASEKEVWLQVECSSHAEPNYTQSSDPIVYTEEESERGIRASGCVRILACDGEIFVQGDCLRIEAAKELVLVFCVRSDFSGWNCKPSDSQVPYRENCVRDLEQACAVSWQTALEEHIRDYQSYFSRVSLCLEGQEKYADTPTDQRLVNLQKTGDDIGLPVLLFDYGRYLMISASRPGTQPMNLQGIWNESLLPPWSSNYTTNINTEMNYWPALPCNLAELQEPLVRMMQELREAGQETAYEYYHAKGFAVHHNVDLWRHCNPVGRHDEGCAVYGFWPMAGGWLCRHLFEQYEYTLDTDFLRESVYPVLRDAARFYLDVLVTDENGKRRFVPSTSPENNFLYDGKPLAVCKTTTMTTSILRELFTNCIKCCEILQQDEEFAQQLREELSQLPELSIGSDGRLLEWSEEYPEETPENRHISHLYALHPGQEISPVRTPELAKAAEKTLIRRTDEGTGWSLGWKINFWARLRDGNHALALIKRQLRPTYAKEVVCQGGGTYPNLFDAHPPFQIDGNFGACAGIAEMLLQTDGEELVLLPALPEEWHTGKVSGLCAKNGIQVEMEWKDGRLQKAVLQAKVPVSVNVCYQGTRKTLHLLPQKPEILQ